MTHPRTQSARDHDDRDLIENVEPTPAQSGASGGNLQRDVASQDEEQRAEGDDEGVTRVRGEDKPDGGDLPNLPNRN